MRISVASNNAVTDDKLYDGGSEQVGLEFVNVTKDSVESEGIGNEDGFAAKGFWENKDGGVEGSGVVFDYFAWSANLYRGRVGWGVGEALRFDSSLSEDV